MCYKKTHGLVLLILAGICLFLISPSTLLAQPTRSEKPKIKDFGSSLKKFKKKAKDNFRSNVQESKVTDEETIKVKTDLIVSEVLVVDRKGNAILNLKESDFVVSENGAEQKTEVFAVSEKATIPRSIVLIIDYSGSQLPYIKDSIKAAKVLVDKLPSQDRMAIVTDDVELLADFTKDKRLLKNRLDFLLNNALSEQMGRSDQYTALLAVLNEMFDDEDIRPVVILQSDGDEFSVLKKTQSAKEDEYLPPSNKARSHKNYSYEDIYSVASKSRATIYSIIPGLRLINRSQEEQLEKVLIMNERYVETRFRFTGRKVMLPKMTKEELINSSKHQLKLQSALLDIAKVSGGYLEFLEKPEDAEKVYSNIFAAMNNRYLIGYYPTNLVQDGKRRDVKIEVKGHPEYIIVGRKTYFSPEH
jgi:VWFA-related protein